MNWNKYTHIYELENTDKKYICLYNSLNMEVSYMRKDTFENINNLLAEAKCENYTENNENLNKLKGAGFIDSNNDNTSLNNCDHNLNAQPLTLTLLLTNACNLDCSYCQIRKNIDSNDQSTMNKEIALESLKLFSKIAPKHKEKTIVFTGGEPTLNFEVIKFIVEKSPQYLDNFRFVIFTNGTLIRESMAQYFKKNNFLIIISLDGLKTHHDSRRKKLSLNGSYDEVIEGIKVCKKEECKLGISLVMGTHNVNEIDNEIFNFLIDIQPDSVGINYPHYLLNSTSKDIFDINSYTDKLISIFKKARQKGLYVENIMRILSPFINKNTRGKECAGLGKGLTISPTGMVGPCKSLLVSDILKTNISKLKEVENLNEIFIFKDWINRSTFTLDKCSGCDCIAICGTGCAYDAYVLYKNIHCIDERICVLSKKVLQFIINELFLIKKVTENEVFIPSINDRNTLLGNIAINSKSINRSVGHDS